jgi:hypothetical protein
MTEEQREQKSAARLERACYREDVMRARAAENLERRYKRNRKPVRTDGRTLIRIAVILLSIALLVLAVDAAILHSTGNYDFEHPDNGAAGFGILIVLLSIPVLVLGGLVGIILLLIGSVIAMAARQRTPRQSGSNQHSDNQCPPTWDPYTRQWR